MALVLALWMVASARGAAQSASTVAGTALDESGGAVPGARVRLLEATRVVATTTTAADGGFVFRGVAAGAYVVEVSLDLFLTDRTNIVVGASPLPPLRVVLQVSSLREAVSVTGAAPEMLNAPSGSASRLPMTVRDTPATVTIVGRALIEERGATDTQEVLKSVPGLTAASPPGSAGSVFYRGFGASQITQLFNGITVQYDAIAARPVDSWVFDRVEVVGGPSSFLYGAGAVGGSINYITKIAEAARNAVSAQLRAGSFGTVEGAAGINRWFSAGRVRHALRADVNRSHSDGFVDDSRRNALSSAVSWRIDAGPRISHTLAGEYQHEKADRPIGGRRCSVQRSVTAGFFRAPALPTTTRKMASTSRRWPGPAPSPTPISAAGG